MHDSGGRIARHGATVLVAFLLTGCSGGHLHRPPDARLAEEATEAVGDLGLDAAFDRQAALQQGLIDRQLALATEHARLDQNATLARVAISDEPLADDWFERDLQRRVRELGVSPREAIEMRDDLTLAERNLASARGALAETTIDARCEQPPVREPLTAAALRSAATEALEAAGEAISPQGVDLVVTEFAPLDAAFVEACAALMSARTLSRALSGAAIDEVDDKIRRREDRLVDARRAAGDVATEFGKLDAVASGASGGEDAKLPSEIVKDSQESLRKLLDGLKGVASIVAEKAVVDERLKRIDAALGILGGTVPDDPGDDPDEARRKVAVAFAGMTGILDKIATFEKAKKTMPRTDLVIVRNELQARKAALAAAVGRQRGELRHLREERAALLGEVRAYRKVELRISQAQRYFDEATAGTALAGKPVLGMSYRELMAMKAASGRANRLERARALVTHAIVLQTHARRDAAIAVVEAKLAQARALHDGNIAEARANTAQWLAIIEPLVAQQARYHAGGVKPEQIAALVFEAAKAAGLFAIASGVN